MILSSIKMNNKSQITFKSKLNTMNISITALLFICCSLLSLTVRCQADPLNRRSHDVVKRSLHAGLKSSSLLATPGKKSLSSGHSKVKLRFASDEDNAIHTNNDTAEDYDFVLDLNEHEDFDRLLNMLSRSGPAKTEDKRMPRKSSTFLDRHDELAQSKSEALLASYKGRGFPVEARKINPIDEGSRFDDLQKQKEEQEQKRLEALYFEEIHDHRKSSDDAEEKVKKQKNSGNSCSTSSLSLVIILLSVINMMV